MKKKVAVIHPEAGFSSSGGSQLSAYEMAEHLATFFDVKLLSSSKCSKHSVVIPCIPRGKVKKAQRNRTIDWLLTRFVSNPSLLIESLTSFLTYTPYLMFKRSDVIYPNNDYGGLAVAAVIRKLFKTPILYTERAGMVSNGKVLRRNLKFKPDCLVVFNQETKEYVHSIAPEQRVEVIPNGVNLAKFSPQGEKYEHGLQGKVLLTVGALNRQNHKRIHLAIEAVSQLTDVSLLICGDGPDVKYFNDLCTQKLGSHSFKIVTVDFADIPNVYRSVDAFTLPSEDEPFGRVYLEAMGCGLPVIATDDAMRRLLVGKAGKVCDVTSVFEYAETIETVLSLDWDDKPLKQAAAYSWASITEKYAKVINSL
ncbi:glycosyltransferase [Alteromonas sp. MCA-1]|jgi:glycosyltransferase involved in cell wall biosynthesis|uniref:glycosyltransferase n=1 Tax=Alteromonas sp. MCA-1 TaxID=2917731 RepID=UPI001EF877C8|nr:glycosyltransferase [Alteromonas sp. MCA-1]MCG7813914.1 glycosyltransferase [Alteromonas sp. MCA-1]